MSAVTIISSSPDPSFAKTGSLVSVGFSVSKLLSSNSVNLQSRVLTATQVAPNHYNASITIQDTDPEGSVTFSIIVIDYAGNQATTSTTSDNSAVIIDHTKPTLTSQVLSTNGPVAGYAGVGKTVTLTYSSSEPLWWTSVVIAQQVATIINSTSNQFSATITINKNSVAGLVNFTIQFLDRAGNVGNNITTVSDTSFAFIETQAPFLSSVTIFGNAPTVGYAGIGKQITLQFTSNVILSSTTITLAGKSVTATPATGTSFQTFAIVDSTFPQGVAPFTINFFDQGGNAGVTVTNSTDQTQVIIGLFHFSFLFFSFLIFFSSSFIY